MLCCLPMVFKIFVQQIGGNEIQSEKYLKQYALSVAGKLVIPPDSELTIVGELLLDESVSCYL